jgi:hypothetical protein
MLVTGNTPYREMPLRGLLVVQGLLVVGNLGITIAWRYPLPRDTPYHEIPPTTRYPLPRDTPYHGIPPTTGYPLPRDTPYHGIPPTTGYPLRVVGVSVR